MQDDFFKRLLKQFVNADADEYAFSLYDGETIRKISYNQFANDILRFVAYFDDRNIFKQHVALIAPNSYEWFVCFFAITLSGNTVVAINPALPLEMITFQCNMADVKMIIGEDALIEGLKSKQPAVYCNTFDEITSNHKQNLDNIYSAKMSDVLLLLFTSGTTGSSKIVEISYENLQHSVENMGEMFLPGYMDSAISTVPLYHIAGIRGGIAMLYNRKHLCIGRGIKYLLLDIPVFNPTYILLVPIMVENIVKLLKRAASDKQKEQILGKQLRRITVAGAALKKDVTIYLLENGFILDNVYALTESTGDGMWCLTDNTHIGSIGKPCGDLQCCIQNGEILLKSPSIMKGYYKDANETGKVIVDGWLHTGDAGYCDEDGYYYITGRMKNVIILSNGENVNPEEIENTFYECDSIEECLVYSDGKGICADVFAKNQDFACEFIKAYNESMPLYRQVYKINYTKEPLPKTGSGKIKRKENK